MIQWKYEEPKPKRATVLRGSDIIDGHPVTDNDNSLLCDLSFETRIKVLAWIKESILPASYINPHRTSYGVKHILERETGIYLTNNQFKDAMLMCGFLPTNRQKINWEYRIKERSPAFKRENERIANMSNGGANNK